MTEYRPGDRHTHEDRHDHGHSHDRRPEHDHDGAVPPPMSAADWDERYSGDQVWSGEPNAALVDEASDLRPGRALDVGCGEGADAVWLARRGWRVTALDISARAVERTAAAARSAGVQLDAVAAGFMDVELTGAYELVSAMYPVLLATAEHTAERRLADLVAPGGTLLFVHHEPDRESGFPVDDYVSPGSVAAYLRDAAGWTVVIDERRERRVVGGSGAHHHVDLVVRAQRER